jgi:nucleoside-diphosphate-sugar epimerase
MNASPEHKKISVLVTGAAGFLGRALVRKLATDQLCDFAVLAVDKSSMPFRYGNVVPLRVDLGGDRLVLDMFDGRVIDAVVHLAASPGVWFGQEHPKEDLRCNTFTTLSAVDIAEKCSAKRIIFASTCQVLDFDGDRISSSAFPKTNYGISKFASEYYVIANTLKHNMEYSVLRMSWIYGPGMKKNPMYDIIQCRNRKKIELYLSPDSSLDFIFIDDVVEAFYQAIVNDQWRNKILNISSEHLVKLTYLVAMLEKITSRRYEIMAKDSRVVSCCLDNKEAVELGWRPLTSIEDGFERTVKYFIKNNS